MSNTILRINGIECGYGAPTVIRDFNLEVAKSEFIGVLGPNGSGKTTLLRAITNVIPLRKGSIEYQGESVGRILPKKMARKIAVVLQMRGDMFFRLTVEEMVTLGRIPHIDGFQWALTGRDRAVVENSMRITDVMHLKDREMEMLSGGERQRVFIARALAQEPELLLLDEPTLHLDISHSLDIFRIISRLIEEKEITVLCVMHDLNLASVYCGRLVIIREGRIAYEGSPQEVMKAEYLKEVYDTDVKIYRGELSDRPQILY